MGSNLMIARKLQAIDYQYFKDFSLTDDSAVRNVVNYIEDKIVQFYATDERVLFLAETDEEWNANFSKYLQDLSCPVLDAPLGGQLNWLLSHSLILYNKGKVVHPNTDTTDMSTVSAEELLRSARGDANTLLTVNYDSNGFKGFVNKLVTLLNLPQHPDHKVAFKAACILICRRLQTETIAMANNSIKEQKMLLDLKDINAGVDAANLLSHDVAVILRLLHIEDLRTLQTEINATLVAVQELTAEPKTDERLGRVGY